MPSDIKYTESSPPIISVFRVLSWLFLHGCLAPSILVLFCYSLCSSFLLLPPMWEIFLCLSNLFLWVFLRYANRLKRKRICFLGLCLGRSILCIWGKDDMMSRSWFLTLTMRFSLIYSEGSLSLYDFNKHWYKRSVGFIFLLNHKHQFAYLPSILHNQAWCGVHHLIGVDYSGKEKNWSNSLKFLWQQRSCKGINSLQLQAWLFRVCCGPNPVSS